jgi:hypothetical protein
MKIMDIVTRLFKKETPNKLEGRIYAVTTGDYAGQILLLVKQVGDSFWFLSIPLNNNQEVPKDKFEFGMNNDIIEYIGDLPKDIFKTVKAQFEYNENSNY